MFPFLSCNERNAKIRVPERNRTSNLQITRSVKFQNMNTDQPRYLDKRKLQFLFIYEFCFFSFDKRMNHRISDSASFLKICRTQASIYYKFQSSLMYYCLPEPNATTVIKITERNKNVVTHNCARCRVETKFSRRKRFLVSCLSYQACTRLRFNCIVTA